MRSSWIKPRLGKENVTQMNFARNGYITEEMDFVAKKENLPSSLIMEEVARGRLIIPANINHLNLEPMSIGIASRCKVNANIGASPNASDINEEVEVQQYKDQEHNLIDLFTRSICRKSCSIIKIWK